jgi:nucleoside triphosphate diphosphatase
MIFEPSNKIEDLLKIMEAVRDPVSGCPWDIKQTYYSIAHYMFCKAEEVEKAINNLNAIDRFNKC